MRLLVLFSCLASVSAFTSPAFLAFALRCGTGRSGRTGTTTQTCLDQRFEVAFGAVQGRPWIRKRSGHDARAEESAMRMALGQESQAEQEYICPPGCRRLRLEKPLGIVFEEVDDDKGAIVVEVAPGSNAQKAGVKLGERLVAVSAATLKAGKEGEFSNKGYGGRPFDNWSIVMYPCYNEPFRQIMRAFVSNNERWGINHVSIVLQEANSSPSSSEQTTK